MKLPHIRVKDFRSFSGEHDFDIGDGVNYFVGPNNCGKSNLIRALALALDPDAHYDPLRDRPARDGATGAPPVTKIILTFRVGSSAPERTLLKRARTYEVAVREARGVAVTGRTHTYADASEVKLVASYLGSGARRTTFQAKGLGASSLAADHDDHKRLESQFWSVVRFGVVRTGEDLESLLAGKFREILQLVIADHLREEMAAAEAAREQYVSALQAQLLAPLKTKILERVGQMFPEIKTATLVPDVPSVAETLSSVDVQLGDVLTTALADKGTGVRGAVLVSMLQYLAEQSRRSLILAVEEPEAFLHPSAQEGTQGQLEALARRDDVSLLVTTHSPYVISRSSDTLVTELRKSQEGVTSKAGSARGSEDRAQLLGSLYRDAGLAKAVENSLMIPQGLRAVVITEGYTDGRFLHDVLTAVGRGSLIDGIHFIPAGRAANVVPQAVLVSAATDLPVIALLDHDESGRAAADKLKSFNWSPKRNILSLRQWPGACANHDVEIEDLLPGSAVQRLVARMNEEVALDGKERCGAKWHLRPSKAWKEEAIESLAGVLQDDPGGMVWLAEELGRRMEALMRVPPPGRMDSKA